MIVPLNSKRKAHSKQNVYENKIKIVISVNFAIIETLMWTGTAAML